MASRQVQYDPIEGVENIAGYEDGGLRPVLIGDELADGRFKIINKLGNGSYSTVWLAEDVDSETLVALKIHRADHSPQRIEDKLMKTLLEHQNDYSQFVLLPKEQFSSPSANGIHRVEVYPVAGASAFHRMNDAEHGHLEVADAKCAILHTARGLEFLHSAGIGHGDLYSSNILQRMDDKSDHSEVKARLLACKPEKVPVSRLDGRDIDDGVPEYAVIPLDMAVLEPYCPLVSIADLGCIFKSPVQVDPVESEARNTICSPERLVGLPYGLPADIWSLGCTIFELLFGTELFDAWPRSSNKVFESVIRLLGKPPQDLLDALPGIVPEKGLQNEEPLESFISRARVGDEEEELPSREDDFSEHEMSQIVDLLLSMLRYEPSGRLTIAQVLDHPWMQSLQDPV